jgi:hypothetical protein
MLVNTSVTAVEQLMKKVLAERPRKYLALPALKAVVQQESSQSAFFEADDDLLRASLKKASVLTGLTEAQILKLATLNSGKIAKFRFEPDTYKKLKYAHLSPERRFYISSSWGLGQHMGYNIVGKKPDHQIASAIRDFAGNEAEQLRWTASNMDTYLTEYKGDLFKAYCRYNGGRDGVNKEECRTRAKEVINLYEHYS